MENSRQNGEDMQETSTWSRGDLVEDSEKDDGGEYVIDSGNESETFDDDFIELEYGEIEMGVNEDQGDDEGEKACGLVVMEDEEAGLDDEEACLDDEQKKAMKELKRMDRRKWTKKQPAVEPVNMESDLRTVNLKIGQIFCNAKVFKEAAREHAIKQGRLIWFPCNEKFRVQGVCKCKLDSCSWSIWASCYEKNNPALMIKTLNDKHTCPRVQKNRLANSAWLAKRYTEALRPGREFKMFDFLGKVRKDYVCQPSKSQVYRAKRKAGLLIEGSLATQYAKLWDYAEEIRRSNPGSTVVIDTEEGLNKVFRRIYICLEACKVDWISGCRLIIGSDACHTKGNHKAQLMFAIGIDADNSYYPIAYAIVEKECYMTWFWFLSILKVDLKLDEDFRITFMTDKQKGLVEAIRELWKNSEHRNCVRHLYANFKKKFKTDEIRPKVWEAAKATTVEDFNRVMTKIKDMNEKAHEWLCEKPAEQWSKSHFKDWPKCDMLLNNLCESVNGDRVILEARSAPIFTMLEMIRVKIMNRRANRRIDMEKWYGNIGPRVAEFMELQAQHSGQFVAHWGGEGHYQINRGSTTCAVVDLDQKTCTCRIWNLTGIPCSHSMAAIYSKGDDPTKYVDKWYLKDTYKKCYSSVLHGIRMENLWFKTDMPPLLPPIDVKQAGRPRKLRIKEIGEIPPNARKIARIQKMYTCSKCHQTGHSAKTCAKRAELQAKLKKKIGTQKKNEKSVQGGVSHEVQSEVEAATQPEYEEGVLTLEHVEANDPLEWFGNLSNVLNTLQFDPEIVERLRALQQSNQATTSKSAGSMMKKKSN